MIKCIEHPVFGKYFKMLYDGIPQRFVEKQMEKDNVDTSVLENFASTLIEVDVKDLQEKNQTVMRKRKVKLCEHPVYSKYFNMLKKGVPEVSVRHAMMKDGVETTFITHDPQEEIEIEEEEKKKVKLCEHPVYSKYFNMLKKGIPKVGVCHAMRRDKVDESIIDRDPNEEIEIEEEEKKKVKLCEHPIYSKYFNMLKKGVPKVAVCHAMRKDKVDESIIDRDPNEEIEIENEEEKNNKDDNILNGEITVTPRKHKVALKDAPEYKQFFVMRERGLSLVLIKRFMIKNDKDPSIIDRDPQSLIEVEVDFIPFFQV